MAAYLIADLAITDAPAFAEYREKVTSLVAAHGGRYLARGGATEVFEGSWRPDRLVVLEFPTMAALKAFWEAPDYEPLRALRIRSTRSNIVAVEGV